jgi:hypothetical protein
MITEIPQREDPQRGLGDEIKHVVLEFSHVEHPSSRTPIAVICVSIAPSTFNIRQIHPSTFFVSTRSTSRRYRRKRFRKKGYEGTPQNEDARSCTGRGLGFEGATGKYSPARSGHHHAFFDYWNKSPSSLGVSTMELRVSVSPRSHRTAMNAAGRETATL